MVENQDYSLPCELPKENRICNVFKTITKNQAQRGVLQF